MSRGSDFVAALQPAAFRGVPFGVSSSRKVFGRRTAIHDYPFRDVIWVEDLGRQGRRIQLAGFLVADSVIYGGGDVISQQEALIAAAETAGKGTLVHPTLGPLQVSCLDVAINESLELGGVLEVDFTFVEAGERVFPASTTSTTDAVTSAAATADTAASTDFASVVTPLLSLGAITPLTAVAALGPWGAAISAVGADATNLAGLAAQLPGEFGRFFNGANVSALSGLAQLLGPDTTLSDLVANASAARSAIASAVETVADVAGHLGLGISSQTPSALASAAQSAVASALSSIADPADAIRLLNHLAQGVSPTLASATPMGLAIGDLYRRAAAVALARAGTTYGPSSYDDANAVRETIVAVLDNEVQIAGDEGDDASFNALRALRLAVVQDLTARGATLAPMVTLQLPAPIPSLVLAQRLYRDASRADQLVAEAGEACINPLFLPASFQALAS